MLRGGLRSSAHVRQLEAAFARLRNVYPQLDRAEDDDFRHTEIAMLRDASFSAADIRHMAEIVAEYDLAITYSSIHIHIMGNNVDKWSMIEKLAGRQSLDAPGQQVLTIGDSVNDAALFDPAHVDCSVGVAQVIRYREALGACVPRFVTPSEGVDGFMEMVQTLRAFSNERPV